MSTLQTARTAPQLRVEAITGMGLNVASSFVGAVLDNAENVSDRVKASAAEGETVPLSDDDKRDLLRAAFTFALMSPVPLSELGLRMGIIDRWDVGVTYTASAFRFDTKVQFLRRSEKDVEEGRDTMPFDMAIGAQVLRQVYEIPLPGFLKDVFEIEDLSRTDLTIPVIASRELGDYGFVYGGPKFVWSFLQADVLEKVSAVAGRKIDIGRDMWLLGGFVGGAVGYKYVFVMLEANVLYYDYRATILDADVNLSGVDFYPAIALKFHFYSPREY